MLLAGYGCTEPLYPPADGGTQHDGAQVPAVPEDGAQTDASAVASTPDDAAAKQAALANDAASAAAMVDGRAPATSESDAGAVGARLDSSRAAQADGEAGTAIVPTTPLDEQAAQLLGSYITRSYGFWVDDSGGKLLVDELGLASFERTGDRVELRLRICRQTTRSAGLSFDIISPALFPELRRTVSFGADGWSSDDHPIATGFQRDGIAACEQRAGQNVPKAPAQRWLSSTCRCPSAPAQPPTSDDCRVTDDDNDGAPAISYRYSGLGWTSQLATVIRSHHLRGRQTAVGSHFAEMKLDEVGYQLSCTGAGCVDADRFGRPCSSEHNGAQFIALPTGSDLANFSCEMAVARESEFFRSAIPTRPDRCVRDVLTDDPMRP
jgi:hypothetical protein